MAACDAQGAFRSNRTGPSGTATPARAAARRRMENLAWLLDRAVTIPGTGIRIGADGILGLVPGIGDAAGSALALWIVYEAHRLGVPRRDLAKMVGNVGLDFAVGTVPLLGDIFDVAFKASTRNMRIVRRHLDETDGPIIEGDAQRR